AQFARRHIPTAIGILSGLRGRPVAMEWIQDQVQAVRDRSYAGVSFFFYESLWWSDTETLEQRQHSLRQLFSQPVPAPQVDTVAPGA
ncbi:MAG: glycoside hydrolase family 10 protein, partial [Cyanobacteria bacterium P01_G01_bin.4]